MQTISGSFERETPKINPEIESSQQYQSNTSFVVNNCKSLIKSKLCGQSYFNIMKYDKLNLKASDGEYGRSLDHLNLVKLCLNTITLFQQSSKEKEKIT